MAVRTLCVAIGLVALAACSGGGDELPSPTLPTAPPTSTAPTTAPSSTAAPTTPPSTTTSEPPATDLTPELEAAIVAAYLGGSASLYEALTDPLSADTTLLALYWAPQLASGWSETVAEWSDAGRRAEPGPLDLHYQEALSVQLLDATRAVLTTCNVSDVAVIDTKQNAYLDEGLLGSGIHRVEMRLVGDRWLIYSDEETINFSEQAGCGE